MSCGNSRSSKCNPCGPSEAAMNAIANKAAYYARIAQYASDGFSQVYLGAKDVAPTTDNNGNPLIVGALYFNTTTGFLYVWDGTAWDVTTFNETTPFLSTGSTTARTLANRFADVVNVKDFGAVGDGIADDTSAMQNAVNTGKSVFWPQGTYRFNELQINSSYREYIFDNGEILKKINIASNGVRVWGDYNVFQNMWIDGSRTTPIGTPTLAAANSTCEGSYNRYINFRSYNGGQGINLGSATPYSTKGNQVIDSIIENHTNIGIAQGNHEEGVIQNCLIAAIGLEGITVDIRSNRCKVIGNSLYNCAILGGVGVIGIDWSEFSIISNNQFIGSPIPGIGLPCNSGNNSFNIISNNIILNSVGSGIKLYYNAIDNKYCFNNIIEGNTIVRTPSAGTYDIEIMDGCLDNTLGINKCDPNQIYTGTTLTNSSILSTYTEIWNSRSDRPMLGLMTNGTNGISLEYKRNGAFESAIATVGGNLILRNISTGGTYIQTNGLDRLAVLNNGNTGVGTNIPQSILDVVSTTSGLIFPRMTTTQRNAIVTNVDGMVIYNTTTAKLQVRAAGVWVDLH